MKAKELMDKKFVYISPEDSVKDVSITMEKIRRFTCPVVDDNKHLVGWVTSFEITKGLREGNDKIKEIMSSYEEITTINENAPINETTETSDTAEASEVSEDAGNAGDLSENTVTPNNAAPDSKIGFAAKFLHNITESAKNSINSMLQQSSQNADNPQSSASNTVIDTLCEKFQKIGRASCRERV